MYLCIVLTAAFFTVLLAGSLLDCLVAIVNGSFIVLCMFLSKRLKIHGFITNMVSSFLIAVNTMFVMNMLGWDLNQEVVITGSIMPMLPGVAITNAIRDTLQGDYMSGGAKVLEAVVLAASISVGIGAGLAFMSYVLGGGL